MCVRPSLGIEQYVLSKPSEAVHLFVPPRGLRQLCAKLTAWCGLAEEVYQFNSDAKSIVSVACVHPCTSAPSHFFVKKTYFSSIKKLIIFFLFCFVFLISGKKWTGAGARACAGIKNGVQVRVLHIANFVQILCNLCVGAGQNCHTLKVGKEIIIIY